MQNGNLPSRGEDRRPPEGVRPDRLDVTPGEQDDIENATARDTRLGRGDDTRTAPRETGGTRDEVPLIDETDAGRGHDGADADRQPPIPSRADPLR